MLFYNQVRRHPSPGAQSLTDRRKTLVAALGAGIAIGAALCLVVPSLTGHTLVDEARIAAMEREIRALREENDELTEDLFTRRVPNIPLLPGETLPYDEGADAAAVVAAARQAARDEAKFLMVTFGANWCPDCRNLSRMLETDSVSAYVRDRFRFANVDVGTFDRNVELATELGVDLRRGIPVAIFYRPDGAVLGTTNGGELEPARHYSSRQILAFLEDVAERAIIAAPDGAGAGAGSVDEANQ